MNRTVYIGLWVLQVLAVIGLILALALPIQDHSLREFLQYRQNPSPENYRALVEKQRQEGTIRMLIAAPFGLTAVLVSFRLRKYRRKLRSPA